MDWPFVTPMDCQRTTSFHDAGPPVTCCYHRSKDSIRFVSDVCLYWAYYFRRPLINWWHIHYCQTLRCDNHHHHRRRRRHCYQAHAPYCHSCMASLYPRCKQKILIINIPVVNPYQYIRAAMDMNMSLYNVEMKTVSKRHKSSTSMGTNILSNPYLAIATEEEFKEPFSSAAFKNVVLVIALQ